MQPPVTNFQKNELLEKLRILIPWEETNSLKVDAAIMSPYSLARGILEQINGQTPSTRPSNAGEAPKKKSMVSIVDKTGLSLAYLDLIVGIVVCRRNNNFKETLAIMLAMSWTPTTYEERFKDFSDVITPQNEQAVRQLNQTVLSFKAKIIKNKNGIMDLKEDELIQFLESVRKQIDPKSTPYFNDEQ